MALSYCKETIAVGLESKDIITLNAITGGKIAVFSGHTGQVMSIAFLPDGTSLVSGSYGQTIKLWDIQTGGVIRTFQGHTEYVLSVSISADCTTIASGSTDETIHLWNIQTGRCYCIMQQQGWVYPVYFSLLDSQHLMSVSNHQVWEWNIDGYQITPTYDGSCAAFSLDDTKIAWCHQGVVYIHSSDSRAVVAKVHVKNGAIGCCCLSPNGGLVAIGVCCFVYVCNITSSKPCLIESFIGHTGLINFLIFSSPTCLISASGDKSTKFWQIGTSPVAVDVASSKSLLTSPIKSTTLQAKNGIVISTDSDGVVLGSVILPPSHVPRWNLMVLYVVRSYLSFVSGWFPLHFWTYQLVT